MSYIREVTINGVDLAYQDDSLYLPLDFDFDNPENIRALKIAGALGPLATAYYWAESSGYEISEYVDHMLDKSIESAIDAAEKMLTLSFGLPIYLQDMLRLLEAEQQRRKRIAETKAFELERRRNKAIGYVYLLRSSTGYYKIGRTVNPVNRIKTFTVKLPFEVEYEYLLKCADMVVAEKKLHAHFADKRVSGEWFALTPEDVDYIKSLGGVS